MWYLGSLIKSKAHIKNKHNWRLLSVTNQRRNHTFHWENNIIWQKSRPAILVNTGWLSRIWQQTRLFLLARWAHHRNKTKNGWIQVLVWPSRDQTWIWHWKCPKNSKRTKIDKGRKNSCCFILFRWSSYKRLRFYDSERNCEIHKCYSNSVESRLVYPWWTKSCQT